jgi:asparagine synthase (glutamine-hydrolysing)
MISGIFRSSGGSTVADKAFTFARTGSPGTRLFTDEDLLLFDAADPDKLGQYPCEFARDEQAQTTVLFCGRLYDTDTLHDYTGHIADNSAELIAALYRKEKEQFVQRLNGTYAIVIYDKNDKKLLLYRDRFGVEPLYYQDQQGYLAFSSTIKGIAGLTGQQVELNKQSVAKILLFNYNPGCNTIISCVKSVQPAHFLCQVEDQNSSLQRYWNVSFEQSAMTEQEVRTELLNKLRTAVGRCTAKDEKAGVFLSGGMDSSTVLALSGERKMELDTFSYRCRAASFDESHYARAMSDFVGTSHHECDYGSSEVMLMPEVVKGMNEPFCDVGINIATFLLGKTAAASNASLIMTGDGGDELFGGHPVYEADKIAAYADAIPGFLLKPILSLCRKLPDSDQKKSLPVKLKRFAESMTYPRELLSHRWRIYYDAAELSALATPSFLGEAQWPGLLDDILTINSEVKQWDMLSKSLYSDYQTVVDFYLRRNDLVRRFGLEIRYPLLDHELVEFCASMPTNMKIKDWFDTKYIFKKTMEGVLPNTIIYRKDKLGHSIPLKNWIRDEKEVREMILDHLSEETVLRRGMFNPGYIATLVNDHLSKKRNNSHRLWTLAVLEMWMREHMN